MEIFTLKTFFEAIFLSALFMSSFVFILQISKILKKNYVSKNSLLILLGFFFVQLAIVVCGIMNRNYLILIEYSLSMLSYGFITICILIYRNKIGFNTAGDVFLENVIEQMPGHVYWKDKNGITLGSNINNWKDFGAKVASDFIGKNDFELFPKKEAESMRANDLKVMCTKQLMIIEEPIKKANGNVVIYLSHKVPLYNYKKQVVGILGISLDVTEDRQKQTERLELLEDIISLMPGHVYWVNTDNVYLGCNNNQAKSAGFSSRKDIIGKRNKDLPWNLKAGVLPETLDNINQQVMKTGNAIVIEEPAILPDGTELSFLSNKAPIYNKQGNIIGMVGISIDITELKKTQIQLKETQAKLEAMTALGANMAHELRTPFAALNLVASGMKKYFDYLLHGYELAKDANLPVHPISSSQIELLSKIPNTIEQESKAANLFIDLLINNINPTLDEGTKEIIPISHCVAEALHRYPFTDEQRRLIQWQSENDFLIKAKEILIIHLLFNLIKNALYHLAKSGSKNKKSIHIWLEQGKDFNKLFFKDTGTGISKDILPYIFNRFFSKTDHGSGIGLTYCKMVMESLRGSIACESEINNYTLFIMSFPVVEI